MSFFSQFEAVWQQLVVLGSKWLQAKNCFSWSWLELSTLYKIYMIDPNHLKTRFLKKIGVQSPTNFLKTPLEIRVEQKFKILATLEKTNFKRKKVSKVQPILQRHLWKFEWSKFWLILKHYVLLFFSWIDHQKSRKWNWKTSKKGFYLRLFKNVMSMAPSNTYFP